MASKQSNKIPEKKRYHKFLKYTGMPFELMFNIVFFSYIGYRLDKKLETKFPVFLSVFAIFSISISIFSIYKRLKKDEKDENIKQ